MNRTVNQKVLLKSKKGDLPGEIVEQRMGKYKVTHSLKPDGTGFKKTSWYENNELKRVW